MLGMRPPTVPLSPYARSLVIDGAILSLLSVRAMRASEIGAVLFPGQTTATHRARGNLLAMRQECLVDANVDDDRARWRITPDGCARLAAVMRASDYAR